ncbi:MAG TPA: hypothetical protein VM120_14670 [Bryobacteraceae bacterium]|nr:hypothetical protein [Bryobacteraceae bacterium]
MSRNRKRWLIGIGLFLAAVVVAVFIAASIAARRFEPYVREQAIKYMQERFNSDVELKSLRIHMPKAPPPLRLLFNKGRGGIARVEGEGISMRYRGATGGPPLFSIRKFHFDVNLGTLLEPQKIVPAVFLEGMEIHIPPKGELRSLSPEKAAEKREAESNSKASNVLIERVNIKDATLVLLPRDKKKVPLDFAIHQLQLTSVGAGLAMKYDAKLTNPKPPGMISSQGAFGPWVSGEPGDTPLSGDYNFANADLGVFRSIAGILQSTGSFEGTLSSINARGEASVPDFRLKRSGNPVPLKTRFEVLVDGTNGDTILKPVRATLGRTNFTTSGGIIKHERERRRAIGLNVNMPKGNLQDVLRLAMKGEPFMTGVLKLNSKIQVPPLSGKVVEKLILDGSFEVSDSKFLRSTIQEKIDGLSRRGQGQPKNGEIDEVVSNMSGVFHLDEQVITFRSLYFEVPGAAVALSGSYNLEEDVLDFHGALKLQAKVSQTVTGWKRWALKPVDPFFAKNGAGTFLRIKVEGSSKEPKFGLDRTKKNEGPTEAGVTGR